MTIKYLKSGERVSLIQKLNNGYLIDKFIWTTNWEGEEEQWPSDNPSVVGEIFDEPPRVVLDGRVAELNLDCDKLVAKKSKLIDDVRLLKLEYNTLFNKLDLVEKLKPLVNHLNGNMVTHYLVLDRYRPKIEGAEQTDDYGRNTLGQKLLTLYGDSNGNLVWRINQYRDGSGSHWRTVIPCSSMDEAKLELENFIQELVNEEKPRGSIIEVAKKYDIKLPKDYIEAVIKAETADLFIAIDRKGKEIRGLREKISKREKRLSL